MHDTLHVTPEMTLLILGVGGGEEGCGGGGGGCNAIGVSHASNELHEGKGGLHKLYHIMLKIKVPIVSCIFWEE